MASSPSHPVARQTTFRPEWTYSLGAEPRGVMLARERGWVLAWDAHHWLHLLGRAGARQAQWRAPEPLAAACCADDGSAYAAASARGRVWWLAPDLMPAWEKVLPHPVTAAALDPFGLYLAVADQRGGLHFFDRAGKRVHQAESPRALHHFAFVPAAPFLVGAADYGLVVCFEFGGRLAWRDGLVAHVGALTVSEDGGLIALACFSEGLQRYTVKGQDLGRLTLAEPCRLAALTFDGRLLLAAGSDNQLFLLDREGTTRAAHRLEQPALALALGALGDRAVVALADGTLTGLALPSPAG